MKRRLAGLVGVLLAVTLLTMAMRLGGERTGSQTGIEPPATEVKEPRQLGSLSAADPSRRASADEQRTAVAAPGAGKEKLSFERSFASGRAIEVVADDMSLPLPGAWVTFLAANEENRDEGDLLRRCLINEYPEQDLNRTGKRYRADAQGRLFVPAGDGIAMRRHEERWNLLEVRGDSSETIELRLLPDTSITFRVLTSDGLPAGRVDVLFAHIPDAAPYMGGLETSNAKTGTVVFEHIGRKVQEAKRGLVGGVGRLGTYSVLCQVLGGSMEVLPRQAVHLLFRTTGANPKYPYGNRLSTDLEGRLFASISMGQVASLARRLHVDVYCKVDGQELMGSVNWTPTAGVESVDLGLLALAPLPVIASGFLRTAAGTPVPGARIRAFEKNGLLGEGHSHADGSFALNGRFPALEDCTPNGFVDLLVTHPDFLRLVQTRIPVGQKDLLLLFEHGGSVSGRLLCDPVIAAAGMKV